MVDTQEVDNLNRLNEILFLGKTTSSFSFKFFYFIKHFFKYSDNIKKLNNL